MKTKFYIIGNKCYDIKNTDANTYKSRKKNYLEIFCKYFITTI